MLPIASGCLPSKDLSVTRWSVRGELPPPAGQQLSLGVAGPLAGRIGELLLVGGGANFPDSMPWLGGKKKYYDEVFVLRRNAKGQFEPFKKEQLPFPLAYSANVTVREGVISAGGENASGPSGKVLLFRWQAGTDSLLIGNLPDLPQALTNAAAAAIGTTVYLAGGETATGVSQKFYSLDYADPSDGWQVLPDLPKPVSHTVLVALGGEGHSSLYLLGGRRRNAGGASDLYTAVFQYDPHARQWSPRRPLPYSLSAGTGVAVGEQELLLFGGDRGEVFRQVEELIAAITKEENEHRRAELTKAKADLQAHHPGFSREVLRYNAGQDAWSTGGSLPFETPVTTTAVPWGREVVLPSGEIKAGVRTPRILVGVLKK